jgi:hypothetical protein
MGYKAVPLMETENLLGVTGSAGGNATAVGALGLVVSISDTGASRTPIPSFSKLLTGAATGMNGAYLVGQQGTIFRAGGSGLVQINGCPDAPLRAVSTVGAEAWVVGWDGTICHVMGNTATPFPFTDARWFNGVYAASPTSLWLVGAGGTLLNGYPTMADGGAPDASKDGPVDAGGQ